MVLKKLQRRIYFPSAIMKMSLHLYTEQGQNEKVSVTFWIETVIITEASTRWLIKQFRPITTVTLMQTSPIQLNLRVYSVCKMRTFYRVVV